MRRSCPSLTAPAFLLALGAACGPADRPEVLAVATAGTGGVYYVLGGGMAERWSREIPGYRAVAEVTGGSVENLNLLLRGEVQVAFAMGTVAYQAYRGTGPFAGGIRADGHVDAGFWSVGPLASSIVDLATTREVRLVPIEGEEHARAVERDPTLRPHVIPAGTYPRQSADIRTVSTPNVLVARADLPDDVACALVASLFTGRDALAAVHPAAGTITRGGAAGVTPAGGAGDRPS